LRLTDLEPQFLAYRGGPDGSFWNVDTIGEANGIFFVCPKCMHEQKMYRPGVHGVICWDPSVPQTVRPIPGRWKLEGTGYHDLSLTAGSSSILLTGPGCGAHFFVKNGEITGGNW
jgi:hypothetical protein